MTHTETHTGTRGQAVAACPSDLDLAQFVEGTITPVARTRMLTHLDECDDCREVAATVLAASPEVAALEDEAPSRGPRAWWLRRPAVWASGVAMAAMVVFALRTGPPPPEAANAVSATAWADVAAAVGPARAVEARLSGLPTHVPLASPTRAAASETDFTLQALAGRLDAADVRGAARHVAGVARLVAGRAPEAITLLEAALADAPPASAARADVLADLSAAHAEFAEMSSLDHWAKALGAADDALALDPTHAAARFNRALALERLARTDAARRAWQVIADDGTVAPGWRDEAAGHVRALAP